MLVWMSYGNRGSTALHSYLYKQEDHDDSIAHLSSSVLAYGSHKRKETLEKTSVYGRIIQHLKSKLNDSICFSVNNIEKLSLHKLVKYTTFKNLIYTKFGLNFDETVFL